MGMPRYHSRGWPPPRPVGTAPRPPKAPEAPGAPPRAAPAATTVALSRTPPRPAATTGPGLGSTPDCVSYIRIMPLWLYATEPRYPGDHPSMNAWVYTPGMPHLVICDSS